MKKYYPKPRKKIFAFCVKAVVSSVIFVSAFLTPVMINAQGLVFNKPPVLISGSAGQDNAVYRFPTVTNNIDALVKIKGRSSSLVQLLAIDLPNVGHSKAFQPQVTFNNDNTPNGVSDWWMEFEITIVTTNTTTPVVVKEFDVTAIDVDGNGKELNEWVAFYNLNTYVFESNSLLQYSTVYEDVHGISTPTGKKITGVTANYVDIDTSATKVMVTANYENTNQFRVRAGGHSVGRNGAADRMYSFWFKSFTFNTPVKGTLPVKLSSFTAKKENTKAVLNWGTEQERNVSHFVIERSLDGTDFTDAGLIFTIGNSDTHRDYVFADDLKNVSNGIIYYRLKIVDLDGRYERSTVRIIRVSAQNETTTILTYPNPVMNNLRITLPSSWQDSKVVIDVVNSGGLLVKHIVSARAGQTETLNVSDLDAGIYIIKASNGTGTAIQRIIKSK